MTPSTDPEAFAKNAERAAQLHRQMAHLLREELETGETPDLRTRMGAIHMLLSEVSAEAAELHRKAADIPDEMDDPKRQ